MLIFIPLCRIRQKHSADTGCRIVYGGHGGAVVPLVNAIVNHPDLTWVYARNEHDAATMAAAHAKLTGQLGVVVATSGPGATNLTTGLMEAVLDEVSVLALTGLKPTSVLGHWEFQDVNQSQLFVGAGIAWSKDAPSASGVVPLLRDAISNAFLHRTCAHIAIPEDVQALPSPLPLKKCCTFHTNIRPPVPAVDLDMIIKSAKTLVGSGHERNVIAVGLKALPAEYERADQVQLSDAILELATVLKAPVLTRLEAKGMLDESHPMSFGVIGVHGKPGLEAAATLISTSDRILSIGVSDESLLLCNKDGIQVRKLIDVQPDGSALKTRYQAEHQILGDATSVCRALLVEIQKLEVKVGSPATARETTNDTSRHIGQLEYMMYKNPAQVIHSKLLEEPASLERLWKDSDELWRTLHATDWVQFVHDACMESCFQVTFPTSNSIISKTGYCHPATVLSALSEIRRDTRTERLVQEATVCVDVGDITLWASLCLSLTAGSRVLYSERLGTMGYGVNAGVAAVLANKRDTPSASVVLVGDGAFQMTLQELATFNDHARPDDRLLVIVFDNSNLARVLFGFEGAKGTKLSGPDYIVLAKAYGGDGILLDHNDPSQVRAALHEAVQKPGLFIVHVKVDPAVKADMASFKFNRDLR